MRVFQVGHNHYANEGLELNVTFAFTRDGINGGDRVCVITTNTWELCYEAGFPCLQFGKLFRRGVVLRLGIGLNTYHFEPSLTEAVVVRLFGWGEGCSVIITGVGTVVDFFLTTFDHFAVGRTKHLLTMNSSMLLYSAVDV